MFHLFDTDHRHLQFDQRAVPSVDGNFVNSSYSGSSYSREAEEKVCVCFSSVRSEFHIHYQRAANLVDSDFVNSSYSGSSYSRENNEKVSLSMVPSEGSSLTSWFSARARARSSTVPSLIAATASVYTPDLKKRYVCPIRYQSTILTLSHDSETRATLLVTSNSM